MQYQRRRTSIGQAYIDIGEGEPIVLVHGVGLRIEAWQPQISELSKTHRVIAVDMPGHGESDPLASGSTLEDFVHWLASFLDTLSLHQVNLAGHSMGALISGGLAATASQRVKRLALLNSVFKRDASAKQAVLSRAEAITGNRIDIESPLQRWFGNDQDFSKIRQDVHHWLAAMNVEYYATAYRAFACGDATYASQFKMIRSPSIFLTGENDVNSTIAMSQAMANVVENGEVIVVAGQGHMVNLTAPQQVTQHLQRWLKRNPT